MLRFVIGALLLSTSVLAEDSLYSKKPFLHIFSVDCKWSQWTSCSEDCGLGYRTRSIEVQAQYMGQDCKGKKKESCKIKECPRPG